MFPSQFSLCPLFLFMSSFPDQFFSTSAIIYLSPAVLSPFFFFLTLICYQPPEFDLVALLRLYIMVPTCIQPPSGWGRDNLKISPNTAEQAIRCLIASSNNPKKVPKQAFWDIFTTGAEIGDSLKISTAKANFYLEKYWNYECELY